MEITIDGKDPFSCDTTTILEAFKVLKSAYRNRQNRIAQNFYQGQRVYFFSKRKGYNISGVIERVNIRTISVRSDHDGKWKVSPGFLKPELVKMVRKTS